jgi:glyoxylase-like metal-dependent hydrolase (beta-lactamase superfamily II)
MRAKWALLGCALAALSACAQDEQAEPAAPAVRLYAMDCGAISVGDADAFSDDGAYAGVAADLVDPCYLIRHPSGDLLWDLGLPESLADDADGHSEGGFNLSMREKLTAQLAELELTPADIEFISFSHSHFDHLGNATLFPQATWIVDAEERAHMFSDTARADPNFPMYAALENLQPTLIEGDADYDVFGDGSVVIVQAPGHTPGHTILKVTLPTAGVVLLTGDMWHLPESRANRRVPRFNTDRAQTLASTDKIEAIAAETNARVIRQHVAEDFAALPAFPQALE